MNASIEPHAPDQAAPSTPSPRRAAAGGEAPTSFYAPVGLDPDFVPRAHESGVPRRTLWGRLTGLIART